MPRLIRPHHSTPTVLRHALCFRVGNPCSTCIIPALSEYTTTQPAKLTPCTHAWARCAIAPAAAAVSQKNVVGVIHGLLKLMEGLSHEVIQKKKKKKGPSPSAEQTSSVHWSANRPGELPATQLV
jgi:hypothetical protein